MNQIPVYAKSLLAALIAFLTPVATALSTGDNAVSAGEWVASAIAGLVALTVVAAVPNKPADPPAGPEIRGH